MSGRVNIRSEEIRVEVRRAVNRLKGLERRVVEGYYFDGNSLARIAHIESVSVNRIVTIHRQSIRRLRQLLTPFVERMFGIAVASHANCNICRAAWRSDAEAIIDTKTPGMTWGDVLARMERATGWRAPSPQTIIVHHRKHRTYQPRRKSNENNAVAWPARLEVHDFDRIEDGA